MQFQLIFIFEAAGRCVLFLERVLVFLDDALANLGGNGLALPRHPGIARPEMIRAWRRDAGVIHRIRLRILRLLAAILELILGL